MCHLALARNAKRLQSGIGDLEIRVQSCDTCGLHLPACLYFVLYNTSYSTYSTPSEFDVWWPLFRKRINPKGNPSEFQPFTAFDLCRQDGCNSMTCILSSSFFVIVCLATIQLCNLISGLGTRRSTAATMMKHAQKFLSQVGVVLIIGTSSSNHRVNPPSTQL